MTFVAAFHLSASASGEFAISIYGGKALTEDGDLDLHQPSGTSLAFREVSWSDRSFESPFYYGARLTYWLASKPHWGASLDFTHAKIYLGLSDTVRVTGSRGGMPVHDRERVSDTFERFNISHGLNFVTLNALHRWFPKGQRDDSLLGRLQPYVGLGAGVTIPHVEATVGGVDTDEYQFGGPVIQGMLGLNYDVWKHLSTLVEYKLSYANLDLDLNSSGKVSTEAVTHHLAFGISYRF